MIFFDTCVWIELLGVHTPVEQHEINQAKAATELLEGIQEEESIVTCREQLIELIKSIEKISLKSTNKQRKANGNPGIESPKVFRKCNEYQDTKRLCETVIEDLRHFAHVKDIGNYSIDDILMHIDLVDINDYIYYDYCTREKINFYTFDNDLELLDKSEYIHIYNHQEAKWN